MACRPIARTIITTLTRASAHLFSNAVPLPFSIKSVTIPPPPPDLASPATRLGLKLVSPIEAWLSKAFRNGGRSVPREFFRHVNDVGRFHVKRFAHLSLHHQLQVQPVILRLVPFLADHLHVFQVGFDVIKPARLHYGLQRRNGMIR